MAGIFTGEFWGGSKDKRRQQTLKTEQQQQKLKDYLNNGIEKSPLYGAGSDFLQSLLGGGDNAFSQFEAPYLQNFQQNIAPGIAERFTGMGTGGGAQSSSALNNSLAQAGGNLQNQLASLHGNLKMQALPQALQYAQQPFTNQLAGISQNTFENTYQPGTTGALGEFFNEWSSGVAKNLSGGGRGGPSGAPGIPGGI